MIETGLKSLFSCKSGSNDVGMLFSSTCLSILHLILACELGGITGCASGVLTYDNSCCFSVLMKLTNDSIKLTDAFSKQCWRMYDNFLINVQ